MSLFTFSVIFLGLYRNIIMHILDAGTFKNQVLFTNDRIQSSEAVKTATGFVDVQSVFTHSTMT